MNKSSKRKSKRNSLKRKSSKRIKIKRISVKRKSIHKRRGLMDGGGDKTTKYINGKGGNKWLASDEGKIWLTTEDGKKWLNRDDGKLWLNSDNGKNWFITTEDGKKWLTTDDGKNWFITTEDGKKWLTTVDGKKWLTTVDGKKWLISEDGKKWLNGDGKIWLTTEDGKKWLLTTDGLSSYQGKEYLESDEGEKWLKKIKDDMFQHDGKVIDNEKAYLVLEADKRIKKPKWNNNNYFSEIEHQYELKKLVYPYLLNIKKILNKFKDCKSGENHVKDFKLLNIIILDELYENLFLEPTIYDEYDYNHEYGYKHYCSNKKHPDDMNSKFLESFYGEKNDKYKNLLKYYYL